MSLPQSAVVLPLISRHAEDAAFYWARFMDGTLSALHDMRSLLRFEQLLDANLEGLRVANAETDGTAGWQASFARLSKWRTADEAFTASILALEAAGRTEHGRCDQLSAIEALAATTPEVAKGLISASAWLPFETVRPTIWSWVKAEQPVLRRAALSASILQRLSTGNALAEWLYDADASVHARALRAVGEIGSVHFVGLLIEHLTDADERCRRWAAWSLALLGRTEGGAVLRAWAEQATTATDMNQAIAALAQVTPLDELAGIAKEWWTRRDQTRLVLTTIRFSGDWRWIKTLLNLMEQPAHARLAADVFAHLTGAPVTLENLWGPAPEEDESEDGGAVVPIAKKMDPDEGLPWPCVAKFKAWWSANHTRFSRGQRYLAGRPLDSGVAFAVLADPASTQLQRHHAALFLRCSQITSTLFDVRAPIVRQLAGLQDARNTPK